MSSQLLTISPSPHIHSTESVQKLMYGVIISLIPAMGVSLFVFGIGALMVTLTAVASCVAFEYIIAKYLLKREPSILDGSAIITGILLAFNVPSSLPWWAVVTGSLVAISVGKMAFGGLGNNPFNPALVGRVFLLISFPVQMTSWPLPFESRASWVDAATGATPLAVIKEGVSMGKPVGELMQEVPGYFDMLTGAMAGCAGEISGLALIIGFMYMMYKKIVTWHTPVAILGTMFVLNGIFWLINPDVYADPVFHIVAGGALLGALYMATDYVTSPMTVKGMVIYGIGIGVITVVIRVFGSYPEGVSFAILIMNGFVPLINKYIKPKRFGTVRHG